MSRESLRGDELADLRYLLAECEEERQRRTETIARQDRLIARLRRELDELRDRYQPVEPY